MLTSAAGANTVSVSTGNKNLIQSVSYQVVFNPVAPLTRQCWSLRWDEERANTVLNQMAFLFTSHLFVWLKSVQQGPL